LVEIVKKAECPTVNLAGGEPTVREDLPELLKRLKKEAKVKRLCVVTNGQNTIHLDYMKTLHESGMDFLFLPLFIAGYKPSGRVINNIIRSLDNAYQLRIPVWIQAAVENTSQIEHVLDILRKYRKIIFNITIRSVRPYGVTSPDQVVHVSDIIRFLGHENDYTFGNHPFNRYINLFGRKAKISSWVNDRLKLDKYDAEYVIHDDSILPFHKGMILDDIHFKSHKDHC
jgi:MoaA/NifB/PqqE/SkfB family radical SAM enzyme